MFCVLPFHAGDRHLAIKLAEWIKKLGGVSAHKLILAYDSATTVDGVIEPLRDAFTSVEALKIVGAPRADWSAGTGDASACNEMWIQVAQHFGRMEGPNHWFWLEPDAIPMKSTWMDELDEEYRKNRKGFMGARVLTSSGVERMSGIAAYPPSVAKYSTTAMLTDKVAWDIAGAQDFKKSCHYTRLIYHVLRTSADAPKFKSQQELNTIPKETAVFHPCKDGSLIDRLIERSDGIDIPPEKDSTSDYVSRLKRMEGNPPMVAAPVEVKQECHGEEILTLADRFRNMAETAARLIEDKPGRKAQFVAAMRDAHLIGPAKKRK